MSGDPIVPFAIGIHNDLTLLLPQQHRPQLRRALRGHCSCPPYLRAVSTEGSTRHGLDGRPHEPVSAIDRLTAAIRLLDMRLGQIAPETRAKAEPLVDKARAVVGAMTLTTVAPETRPDAVGASSPQATPEPPPAVTTASSTPASPPSSISPAPTPPRVGHGGRPILSLKRA